ncbi:hypothetical protein FYJ27_01970 [Anaerosalibacter bizertensis]|uniref:Uncharacterized protein n=1 Tax=Anaerosalibacter bizertensis TaxID=932217 RepID=A0A844FEU2_9FIRM|nr:hypothetical protein [Anaerosalibacter bizertensis]MSS42505.1 hypothetical protein [Anaerosalibacter bizertensis]
MNKKIIFLIFLVLGVLEIFFDFFTVLIKNTLLHKKNKDMSEKTNIKLFFILVFFIGFIYFLGQFVQVMARLFNIPLDGGIFENLK